MLERGEQPHPICTFQDDFQEFEMIDDNEEEEEEEEGEGEEEEEEEGDALEAPPSPSASPIPSPPALEDTQKLRPTTLNLTAPGTQVGPGDGAVGLWGCRAVGLWGQGAVGLRGCGAARL